MTEQAPSPSEPPPAPAMPAAPRIARKRKGNLWLVWLIPLVALLIGLSIVWHEWSTRGPSITISFQSASGLEEGKTQIKFRDVVVGLVTDIRLSESGDFVLVDAQLDSDARGLASKGTEFWVVKPTIGLSGVSGLSTLLSGVYINADSKNPRGDGEIKHDFKGLEQAPPISSDRPGSRFSLRSPTLGSLGPGAPIYFLRIPVGVVTKYELDKEGKFVDIEVFVDAPYDKFVGGNTRFWDESGVYVNVGTDGLTVSTESLATILAGGLAFGNFGPKRDLPANHRFKLYEDKVAASSVPIGIAVPITMRFYQPTRGLETGAPVSFQGVNIGSINSTTLDFDVYKGKFFTQVDATLYPAQLGSVFAAMQGANRTAEEISESLARIVKRGLRAELKTANLLTGSLYISLSIIPDAPAPKEVVAKIPFEVPSVDSTGIEEMQKQIAKIISNIEKIPFEKLSNDLDKSLKELTALSQNLNTTLTPELVNTLNGLQSTMDQINGILASSNNLPGQIDKSLKEMDRAVRATRLLVDELRAKPNSIIFGEPTQSYSRESLGVDP